MHKRSTPFRSSLLPAPALSRRPADYPSGFLMPAIRGPLVIAERFIQVARDAARLFVHETDVEQGRRFVLLGRFEIPGKGLLVVARHTQAFVVQVTDIVQRGRVALFGGFLILAERGHQEARRILGKAAR